MERRLNVSEEKTDEYDEEWNDPRDESIETQRTNMLIDGNEENLPLMEISNQNDPHVSEFDFAFPRFAFSSLRQDNLFQVSNSGPYADIQPRISDAQFEEAVSLSPTSGIREIEISLQNNDIASDSTNGNVPDYFETVSSSLYQQNDGEMSAPFSHGVESQVCNPDILKNNEICLPQSFHENNMEPILSPTRTNTETSDGNFCHVFFPKLDMLFEQITTVDDPLLYHDDTEYNSDKTAEAPSCTKDYDPQEGTSTMNTWVSPDKSSNLLPQKEFCESVGLNAVLNQHSLFGDDKIDESSRNDAGLADPSEDTSTMKTQAQLNSPLQIHSVEKPYKCEIRGKTSTQKRSLKRHSRTHSSGSPHECDVCGKRFASTKTLKKHIQTHSHKKPHECKICGKRFKMKRYLDAHIRTHSDKKPYECEICDKKFLWKHYLKIHYRFHKGVKRYVCKTCKKRFTLKVTLDRHIRTHSRKKPHKCETCGKRFTRKDNLSRHSKMHTSEDPFKCEICGEVFSDVDSLNRHRRTHHEK